MAEDEVNEEQWLYGDSNPDKSNDTPGDDNLYGDKFDNSLDSNAALQPPPGLEPPVIEPPKNFNISENLNKDNQDFDDTSGNDNEKSPDELNDKQNAAEEEEGEDGEVNDSNRNDADETSGAAVSTRNGDDDEDDDDDDSEDDVNVVIGEIKTSSQYTIKRGGPLLGQQLKQPGKFSIEEFETIGTINGIPTHDFSLDSLEDKPWRKPGADITDYFNYGFNEETWRAYCERQKRMRVQESGVGLGQLSGVVQPANQITTSVRGNIPVTIVNDNSKYAVPPGAIAPTVIAPRKAGPPPGRRVGGTIDVLGNPNRSESPPKGNVIQVMTADRREYSRKTGFPDMSIPPPTIPPPGFDPGFGGSEYGADYYNSEMDPYYQAYEPTQDSQWANSGWDHDEIKVLSASYAPPTIPPHVLTSETSNQDSQDASDKSSAVLPGGVSIKQERDTSKERERDRDRDRDRERDRERSERDRERSERHRSDRSHRHRSRSRSTERRSRKHKSRSRSPGHRSHKKKKSKKSDRSKEDSD